MTDDVQWFAGIDWASQAHRVCLIDAGGKIVGERAFAHGGAGLAELCAWLLTVTGAVPTAMAVAIEVPHGPIVESNEPPNVHVMFLQKTGFKTEMVYCFDNMSKKFRKIADNFFDFLIEWLLKHMVV